MTNLSNLDKLSPLSIIGYEIQPARECILFTLSGRYHATLIDMKELDAIIETLSNLRDRAKGVKR